MKVITVTASSDGEVAIQDPFPAEGELAVKVRPSTTVVFTASTTQYERIQPQLDALVLAGALTGLSVSDEAEQGTSTDLNIYIDSINGDDTEGDGSSDLPYASLTRALQTVPKRIDHAVHIHALAGSYAWPTTMDYVVGLNGQLSIDASLAISDFDEGPYTVQTFTGGGPYGWEYADIVVTGGGLTPNEFQGKFLRALDGPSIGKLHTIMENDATTIRIAPYGTALTNGNTFKIVEPGVTMTMSGHSGVTVRALTHPPNNESTNDAARFIVCGIEFDSGASQTLSFLETNVLFQHCIHDFLLMVDRGWVSYWNPPDWTKAIDDAALRDIWDVASIVKSIVGIDAIFYELYLTSSVLTRRGESQFYSVAVSNGGSFDAFLLWYGTAARFFNCYTDTPGKNGIHAHGFIQIDGLWTEAASNAIRIKNNKARFKKMGGNSSNITGYGLSVGPVASAYVDTPAGVTVAGTGGKEVYFELISTGVNWPASTKAVSDNCGAFVAAL